MGLMNRYGNLGGVHLGVDPSFRKGGFAIAIIDLGKMTVRAKTLKGGFLEFQDFISGFIYAHFSRQGMLKIYIEDSLGGQVWGKKKFISIGKNQAICQLCFDYCRPIANVVSIKPREKISKKIMGTLLDTMEAVCTEEDKRAKLQHSSVNTVVSNLGLELLDKRTNQDKRDAIMVAISGILKHIN